MLPPALLSPRALVAVALICSLQEMCTCAQTYALETYCTAPSLNPNDPPRGSINPPVEPEILRTAVQDGLGPAGTALDSEGKCAQSFR